MSLRATFGVAFFGYLFALSLVGASPSVQNNNEDFLKIVQSIKGLTTTVAQCGNDSSQAIRSHQETLQQLLTAVLDPTNSRCQPSDAVLLSLAEVKHKISLLEEKVNSAVDQQNEKLEESVADVKRKQEKIDELLRNLEEFRRKYLCKSPYKTVGVDCIYINTADKLSWYDARTFCKSKEGDLVVPSDVLILLQYLGGIPESDRWFWLGGSDLENEGDFRWLNGSKVDKGWDKGEPSDSYGREDCLSYRGDKILLNDYSCTAELNFICSKA